jgi:hypothetical protein
MAKKKSKSMKGKDGERKLAADAGRAKHKTAGEAKKLRGPGTQRTGSSKQRKG